MAFVFLAASLTSISLFFVVRNFRFVFYNAAFLFLALSLLEGFFIYRHWDLKTWREGNCTWADGYWKNDKVRGHTAPPNFKGISIKKSNRGTVYDVEYTFDENGLRITALDTDKLSKPKSNLAVFFGGSFTFGEGVNDNESLPYIFSTLSNEKFETINFAFHGYGPQQMLRILDSGYYDKIVKRRADIAFYQAIPDHVLRAKGVFDFTRNTPRYEIDENGSLDLRGKFPGKSIIKSDSSD